jgi:hypothetical protein
MTHAGVPQIKLQKVKPEVSDENLRIDGAGNPHMAQAGTEAAPEDAANVQDRPHNNQGPVAENKPIKGTYEKYAVESSWFAARGLQPETLKHFGVFQYDNPKRQAALG